MSAIDLVLLGFVYEQPCSAYEIQKHIEFRKLSDWVKISSPSVFKKIIRLEEKGYLSSRSEKQGKMPEKTIYSITPAGEQYFHQLMLENASKEINILYDFNAVIANLNKIPKEDGIKLLHEIKKQMEKTKSYINDMRPKRKEIPLVGRTIMDQQYQVLDALLIWIHIFIEEYQEEM